jgi:hypothetical protein
MPQISYISEIRCYIIKEWRRIVQEAEEKHAHEEIGSLGQIENIHRTAQDRLMHELVDMKGKWLSTAELEYALDMFNTLCVTSIDYFGILKKNGTTTNLLREFRRTAVLENAHD